MTQEAVLLSLVFAVIVAVPALCIVTLPLVWSPGSAATVAMSFELLVHSMTGFAVSGLTAAVRVRPALAVVV